MADVPSLFLPYLQGGRGVGLGNARLRADDPVVIGALNRSCGTTGGAIDASTMPGKQISARTARDNRVAAQISAQKRAIKRASRHRNRPKGG